MRPDYQALNSKQHVQHRCWNAADLLVNYLVQLQVDYVFGVPGGAIEPFLDALARSSRKGGPVPVIARHETHAAFMAHGYYQATRKLGVCFSTTGPGAANMVNGVASAYENNVPLLAITAQTALANFGRGAFQESSCTGVNTIGIYNHFTRYNTFVSHVDQLEHKIASSIIAAFQPPGGPVHLSIPIDIFRSELETDQLSFNLPSYLDPPSLLDETAVAELCKLLLAARKPVFVIGESCARCVGTILDLARLLGAPILTTPQGKGLVSPYHPLYRGVIGFAGHVSANDTLSDKNVDLIIAAGTSLGEWSTDGWDQDLLLNERLVHIDDSNVHLTRSPMSRLHVRGTLSTIFMRVLSYLQAPLSERTGEPREHLFSVDKTSNPHRYFAISDEGKFRDNSSPVKPQRLMRELAYIFPPSTRYFADTGNSMAWAIHYLHPFDRRLGGQRDTTTPLFNVATEWASMGWAIGACIGAALAQPTIPIVCITGDGAMLMSGQELSAAVQEKLPVIFVVLNDAALGMVKHGQKLGGAEQVGYEIPEVEFVSFARSMGADAYVIENIADMRKLDIKKLFRNDKPTVLDVRIDREEVPPINTRIRALKERNR